MSPRTLVLIRHAKSDWSAGVGDAERPLAPRGRRQAPAIGQWLAAHDVVPDLAVCSTATRARQTWELVLGALGHEVPTTPDAAAYTFDGDVLLEVLRRHAEEHGTVALIGHNPAMEEAIRALTGQWLPMPTSALAVLDLPDGWWSDHATVRYAGRPADD